MPINISHKDCDNSQRYWKHTILTIAIIMGLLILNSSNQAIARTSIAAKSNLVQPQNNQQSAAPSTEPQSVPQILEKDKPIERELKGGEVHNYTITMEANQYLNAVVEQKGIDVVASVFGPDGNKIYEVDSPNGDNGPEPIYLIIENKGLYRIEVRSLEKTAKPGKYQTKIVELRTAIEQDKPRVMGYKVYGEAVLLFTVGTPESINQMIAKCEEAISAFAMAGEQMAESQVLAFVAAAYRDNKNDYDKAERLFQKALLIQEKLLGAEHLEVAFSLHNLGELNRIKGDYQKAEPFLQRALAIKEKVLGLEHFQVGVTLNSLGILYKLKGNYIKAKPFYQRALTIYEKTFGPEHPEVAIVLNNLGELSIDNEGNYVKAEEFYQRALTIRIKTLKPGHPYIAASLANLAALYQATGEYAKSESLYQQSIDMLEKALGPEHPDVALEYSNLAVLYSNKGNYQKAEALYQHSLEIRKKVYGPEHPYIAQTLTNLANTYQLRLDYAKAELIYQQALAIEQKVLGPEHPFVAQAINSLAVLYGKTGNYDKSESLYQQALTIQKKILGQEHYEIANTIFNLAELYKMKGNYDKSESLYHQALIMEQKVLGPDHRDVALLLNSLANLYRAKGDITQTLNYKEQADETRERELTRNLILGSEREKLLYLGLTNSELDETISIHLQAAAHNRQAKELALTGILRRKGRALDAMTNSIAILRRRANAEDQGLLDQLASARTQYTKLSLKGKGKDKVEVNEYNTQLKALADQIESLEKEVSNRSAEFKVQSQPITLTAIQQAIPENTVLIEFAAYNQYDNNDKKGSRHYVAYTLTNKGELLFADLGSADAIDQAITKLRDVLPNRKSSITKEVKPAARALDQLIMQPVRKLLGDKKRLLIAPDGALNLVPFDALVDEHNKYLVENYEISYLTSGRDLLRLQNGIKSDNAPLVMADPDFAQGPGPKFGEEAFEPLKRLESTADEANQIKSELASEKPTVLLQTQATKNALIAVHRPAILHIATHGFFLGNESDNLTETQRIAIRHKIEEGNNSGISLQNPLLRSGLFFAKANVQGEDSTLTALEATGLDLWGTKLVVLSACNTGVGEVKSGDGVYGLRRALVLAGSESQMMSLWPVSDAGTKDLMVAYYEALKHDEGRSAGLRKVRLSFLKKPDRAHPYYWASFIQSGEWANLKGQR